MKWQNRWQEILKIFKSKAPHYTEDNFDELEKIAKRKPGASLIPEEKALLEEDIEDKKLLVSFFYFPENQINGKDITFLRGLFNKIKKISSFSKNKLEGSGFIRDSIRRYDCNNEYKELFRNLPPDIVVLHETEFLGSGGRIFFFFVKNIFYFVSAKEIHLNTH
ncbi:MAG: hypothetical protein PHI88_02900 [Candidatus Pacebacteria bacterium]|nr:hypothetical protein [Candidatus Paceibacterota bacterium]